MSFVSEIDCVITVENSPGIGVRFVVYTPRGGRYEFETRGSAESYIKSLKGEFDG